ncbi:MAG: nitrate reductase cytochrome c-type subunit [Hydrogenothermaceae bacterium]
MFNKGKFLSALMVATLMGSSTLFLTEVIAKEPKKVQQKSEIAPEDVGLRNAPLEEEEKTAPPAIIDPEYAPKPPPGSSKKYKRAYENAPPQIPHSTEGLLPITKENNACLGCHMPEVAKTVKATPIPPTHFINFRTGEKLNHLYQGRYNCTQCHAPQLDVQPLVKNNFKPEYRDPKAKEKSKLIENINEGVDLGGTAIDNEKFSGPPSDKLPSGEHH